MIFPLRFQEHNLNIWKKIRFSKTLSWNHWEESRYLSFLSECHLEKAKHLQTITSSHCDLLILLLIDKDMA